MFDRQDPSPQIEGGWLSRLSPNQLLGYGCLLTVIAGALVMYCAGTISLVLRPTLLQRSTPTEIVHPTTVATPTQAAPTFMNLPPGTLKATPTQAPIPTREPPTVTPTVDLTNPAPTPSAKASGAPPTRTTATVTPRP
jgi:hypothetical protein